MHVFGWEPTVYAGCLYCVLRKLLTLSGKVAFRLAFGVFIIMQLVLVGLLGVVVSERVPEDWYWLQGILVVVFLLSPFAIGVFSYFVFRRLTPAKYILAESERWVADRNKFDSRQIKRRNRIRRWVAWIPAVSVLLFCVFLDHTWPTVSHLVHPGYGRLGQYGVSIPLDWEVVYGDPEPRDSLERSFVRADHWKGMLKNAIDEFSGKMPSLTSSSLGCESSRFDLDHPFSPQPDRDRLVGTRRYSHGGMELACEEFVSRDLWSAKESRTVSCVTAERDFDCLLYGGDESDVSEFLDMMQRLKKRK